LPFFVCYYKLKQTEEEGMAEVLIHGVTGGRVLYVTGVGETIDQAAVRAYAAIGEDAIHFAGMQYRSDIGWQARQAA